MFINPRLVIDLDAKPSPVPSDLLLVNSTSSSGPFIQSTVVCETWGLVLVKVKGHLLSRTKSGLVMLVSVNATANLQDIDEILTNQACPSIPNLKDILRPSCEIDKMHGMVARLKLDSYGFFDGKNGDYVDLVLQLVGVRFSQKHVDVLWRMWSELDIPFFAQ